MSVLTGSIIYPLGRPADVASTYRRDNIQYDYALGSLPLLSAVSKDFPFRRSTTEYRKQQFDNSADPGEQSLGNWWLRSQTSWHYGAGYKFMEPSNNEEVMNGYRISSGVDVWTPGQVSLLPAMAAYRTGILGGGVSHMMSVNGDVWYANGSNLVRTSGGSSTTVTWGGTGTILSITHDGTNYYVVDASGIYTGPVSLASNGTLLWNVPATMSNACLRWVKDRLVFGAGGMTSGNAIYELTGTGPALPSPIFTHRASRITWSQIVESPQAIYVAGYGTDNLVDNAFVHKYVLNTSGAMPTLSSAIPAVAMDPGEYVIDMVAFRGLYLVLATNRGLRVGTIADNGDVALGPYVFKSKWVKSLTTWNSYVYAGLTGQASSTNDYFDDVVLPNNSPGAIRLDLTRPKEDGTFPWAPDQDAGTANALAAGGKILGSGDYLYLTVTGSQLWRTDLTQKVSEGYLQTGYVRYNTIEPKLFKFVRVRNTGPGQMGLSTVDAGGVELALMVVPEGASLTEDIDLKRSAGDEYLAVKLTLNRSATDVTTGAILAGLQIKALPAVKRSRDLLVPILLFQEMKDAKGTRLPPTDIHATLAKIEAMENAGVPVMFSNLALGSAELVTVERVEYQQVTPPVNAKGEGGVTYLLLRTVQ